MTKRMDGAEGAGAGAAMDPMVVAAKNPRRAGEGRGGLKPGCI